MNERNKEEKNERNNNKERKMANNGKLLSLVDYSHGVHWRNNIGKGKKGVSREQYPFIICMRSNHFLSPLPRFAHNTQIP